MTYEQALAAAYQRQLNGARAYAMARLSPYYPSAEIWFTVLSASRQTT